MAIHGIHIIQARDRPRSCSAVSPTRYVRPSASVTMLYPIFDSLAIRFSLLAGVVTHCLSPSVFLVNGWRAAEAGAAFLASALYRRPLAVRPQGPTSRSRPLPPACA